MKFGLVLVLVIILNWLIRFFSCEQMCSRSLLIITLNSQLSFLLRISTATFLSSLTLYRNTFLYFENLQRQFNRVFLRQITNFKLISSEESRVSDKRLSPFTKIGPHKVKQVGKWPLL